jgi:hypothetical protein
MLSHWRGSLVTVQSRLLSDIATRKPMPLKERSENSQVGTKLGTLKNWLQKAKAAQWV